MNSDKSDHITLRTSAWMLSITNALGILALLVTLLTTPVPTRSVAPDFIVYGMFIVMAYLISKGAEIAKLFYAIFAFIWYIAVTLFLPSNFGHPLNCAVVTVQIAMTVAALYFLYEN